MQTKTVFKRHGEHSYRLLIEAAIGYATFILDLEGVVISWNIGAQRLLGYREEEIIGKPGSLIFTNEDRASGVPECELETARRHGRAEDKRWQIKKDGSRFFATGLVFPLKNEEGNLEGFVKIMRDNTERRLTEEATSKIEAEIRQRTIEEAGRRHAATPLGQAQEDFQMLMDSVTEYAIMILTAYFDRAERQVMRPQAKCSMARQVSSRFSQRTSSRRKRLYVTHRNFGGAS